MSQTLQHQVKPSTDVSPPVPSESQLQRRAFPHEVESQADKAIAPPTPISTDWQAQQEKMARARFNPGMISLYPANPLKDEKEKPIQKKADATVESDEEQTESVQRKIEHQSESDEGQEESIQRKTESTAQDELEKDKPSSNKLVQTKLKVGQVGDRYEQEADQVAAKVLTMPEPGRDRIQRQTEESDAEVQPKSLAGSVTPLIQRQDDGDGEDVQAKADQQPANKMQKVDRLEARLANRGGGSVLPNDVRSFMESRFGADLSHVRVHTDFDAAEMNRELRAQAFTYRNHIFYSAGKAPANDELTAHELTHVIQQTGAKSLHQAVTGVQAKNTLQAKISRVSNDEEIQPKRAPASAKSDPAFQSVVANTKAIATEKKQHPPTREKVTEVHAAAKPPSNEVESKAQDKQVQAMNQQKPGQFNAKAFQAALRQKIADVAPSTMQQTEDFKNQNKVEAVKQDIASQVGNEKQQAAGPIEHKTQEAPNPKGIRPKSVTPLPRKKLGKAGKVAARGAAPKRKDESEVSLDAGSRQLDQQMASAKVTETQLQKSNEPKFQEAVSAKKTAQTDAAKAPDQYRQREQGIVAGAEMQAQMTASKDLDAMHLSQDRHVTQVLGKQGEAKGKDEQKRSHVSNHIQGIYNRTKQKVEAILNQLDQDANHTFDQGATTAQNEFNDYVDRKMRDYKDRRYSGLSGPFLWAHDKFMGLPDEVNVFYQQGRDRYLASMDRAIAQVSDLVANRLNAAKAEIAGGKKEIQTYVASLEPSLRQVGQEAAHNIQSQFDDLEQSINDKQSQLIDSLAQKYNDNLKALDGRIKQMKDANKGLVQKAMDKVRDTINTIRDLKNMLMGVLRRAAGVIELIIKDPIQFLKNLISGLKQGFLNFKANIGKHLQQGLMGFLTGTMGSTGITMPSSFDPKGIFSLVTQVLGVTYAAIRSKATGRWGEKKVGHLETSFEAFKTLKREGVGGLWSQIKGEMGNLKSLVLDSIRNFLIEKVVIAGVLWIISLFNPASAFVRACKAIVDIIRFFIERGSQVMELMNAVMDAIVAIAQGSLGAAAKLVESSMVKALPVVLGFIASLLGLGGLTKKVQEIIHKVRKPIDKGIDKVFDKADKFIKKLGSQAKDSKLGKKAVSARDAAKRKKEEAQKWVEEEKEAGRRAIEQQRDKLKQKITAGKNKFANSKVGQKLGAIDQWAKQEIDGLKNKWDKAKKLPGRILSALKNKAKNLAQRLDNKWSSSISKLNSLKLGKLLGFNREQKIGVSDKEHHKLVKRAISELEKPATKARNYKEFKKETKVKAEQIEKLYTAKLKPGIKLSVKFNNLTEEQPDKGISFEVEIAPNNSSGKGIRKSHARRTKLCTEFCQGKDPRRKWISEDVPDEEIHKHFDNIKEEMHRYLSKIRKEQGHQHTVDAKTLNLNLAMASFTIIGRRKGQSFEEIHHFQPPGVNGSNQPLVFASGGGRLTKAQGKQTIVTAAQGGQMVTSHLNTQNDQSSELLVVTNISGSEDLLSSTQFVITEQTELEEYFSRIQTNFPHDKANSYTDQGQKHSEQAFLQLVRCRDEDIANQINSFNFERISDFSMLIFSEREVCYNCSLSINNMLNELEQEAPKTWSALQQGGFNQEALLSAHVGAYVSFGGKAGLERTKKTPSRVITMPLLPSSGVLKSEPPNPLIFIPGLSQIIPVKQ